MRRSLALIFFLSSVLLPSKSFAYSVLTHEAIIDSVWAEGIRPLLLKAYPQSTREELRAAHGYAYGGAIIQDLGYYPLGSHFFSDLTHYVRTGDFIVNLISEAKTLNEYAFALGSLAHYPADEQGHSVAVNVSVGLLYPKLTHEFGPVVTYGDDPGTHLKMEFAFDVVQVAKGYYAPEAYRDFIGFDVATPVLERAFARTYCLQMRDLFSDEDRAVNSYRRVVSRILPEATRVAWVMKKAEIEQHLGGSRSQARRKFLFNLSRSSFEKKWGRDYQHPGIKDEFLAFLMRLIPRVGPLKALGFRTPTPQAESLFMKSFDAAVAQYEGLLKDVGAGNLKLRDLNLDTGQPSFIQSYALADHALARWKEQLGSTVCPGHAVIVAAR